MEIKKTAILFALMGASAALVGCAATETNESVVEQSDLRLDLGEVDMTSEEDVTLEIEESQAESDSETRGGAGRNSLNTGGTVAYPVDNSLTK